MERKLYIINNGLKDLRGHYFETSVSIAEASRDLGLHPVLAAHATCPIDLVPDGLEFHPVFTTDHWMGGPLPPQPDLHGLRGELTPLIAHSIEALRVGTIDFERYLRARFFIDLEPGPESAPPSPPEPVAPPDPPAVPPPTLLGSPSRWEKIKRLARAVLPPVVQRLIPLTKAILRQFLPPFVCNWLRRLLKASPVVVVPPGPGVAAPSPVPEIAEPPLVVEIGPPPLSDPLAIQLGRIGASQEYEYCMRFEEDLERLLTLTGCRPCDHVILPTAHGRELCAVLHLLASLPAEARPTFHLEFRHPLDMAGVNGPSAQEHPYCTVHRVYFEIARLYPFSENLRLYTDTEELSEDYERFSGLEFGVLPIPFRSRLLGNRNRNRQGDALCLAYFGDVRDEKGFHWLPDLIDELMEEGLRPGQVRFLIQASLIHPESEPRSKVALERLKGYSEDLVRLVGLDGPLAPDLYYQLVSEADLLLCPYHPLTYRCRSSGTLTEAISSGIPTVVPRGTWLSRQQPPGSGETFIDQDSFNEAVRQVCYHYATYHARARAGRDSWKARHSPEQLVRSLLGPSDERNSRMGKVA